MSEFDRFCPRESLEARVRGRGGLSRRHLLEAALRGGFLAVAAAVGGCGFRPLYGTDASGTPIAEQLNRVAISVIPDREGQILRNLLIDRFYLSGEPAKPLYRLDVTLSHSLTGLNVKKDATATRQLLTANVSYRLWDMLADKAVFEASSRATGIHNLFSSEYASIAAEGMVMRSVLNQLSDTITSRIGAFLNRQP